MVARTSSSGGISPTNLREMITMVVKAARDAGQTDCVTHLLHARDAVATDTPRSSGSTRR